MHSIENLYMDCDLLPEEKERAARGVRLLCRLESSEESDRIH